MRTLEERFPECAELIAAIREGALCIESEMPASQLDLVHANGLLYTRQSWEWEDRVWQGLQRLMEPVDEWDLEGDGAIQSVARHRISVITGGPGTGKTTLAARLIDQLSGLRIAVAAPTGKAASRLGSLLSGKAEVGTLHSLLPRGDLPHCPFDLFVVDEASMIDAALLGRLLHAIKPGGRLLLMGDPDQLPPVESGHLFADLIELLGERVTRLTRSHRMEERLLAMAAEIREGRLPNLPQVDDPLQRAIEGFESDGERFRLLCPVRHGVLHFNDLLRRHYVQVGEPLTVPILILRNDHELGLYNGETGQLHLKEPWRRGPDQLHVAADDEAEIGGRRFAAWQLPSWELAYCLSVHKSQGSEFDWVLLVVPDGSEKFGREVLYTAVTRAKRSLEFYGEREHLLEMVQRRAVRSSGLLRRVSDRL